jgi:hypothetical protein
MAELLHISSNPVENGPQALGDFGGNQALRHSRVRASDSGVVDLTAQEDAFPVEHTWLVCGAHDIEVVQDLLDVLFR